MKLRISDFDRKIMFVRIAETRNANTDIVETETDFHSEMAMFDFSSTGSGEQYAAMRKTGMTSATVLVRKNSMTDQVDVTFRFREIQSGLEWEILNIQEDRDQFRNQYLKIMAEQRDFKNG